MSAKSLRRLLVEVEERFIVPVRRSPHAKWWAAAHAAAALPLTLIGKQRRYTATADGHPLSVVCVGRRKRFDPLFSRVFEHFEAGEETSRRWLFSPGRLQTIRADVVAVEVHRCGWKFATACGEGSSSSDEESRESVATAATRIRRWRENEKLRIVAHSHRK